MTYIPKPVKESLVIVGKMLVIARKERKWRQIDAAERLGVSRQVIARIEGGHPAVSVGTYFAYAWLLNVPIIPGGNVGGKETKDLLNNLMALIEGHLPKRIIKPEKPIDDEF